MSESNILRKIRKEFDYESYCEQHYRVKTTAREDELRVCCPACADTKFKLYVNNEKKMFNCYRCDFTSGNNDVFDLVALTEGIPRGKAVLRLAHEHAPTTPLTIDEIIKKAMSTQYGVTEDESGETSKIKTIDCLPREAFPLTTPLERREQKFWDYLIKNRGMTEQEVLASKIHYVSAQKVPIYKVNGLGDNKYVGDIGRRVVFPVYGPGGGLVSWLSRPIRDDYNGPKYVNCPDSEINRTLWPMVNPHTDIAIITEGIIDAISVRRLGSPFSAYSSFGKSLGYEQIKILKDMGVTAVILFWDPEERAAMTKTVETLKMQFNEVFVPRFDEWPLGEYDAGDMIKPAVNEEFDGIVALEKALVDPIDVQSLEYVSWQIQ
jgi:DNA primase